MSMVINGEGKAVPAGQFNARCLALIDEVSRTHQAIIITKRANPWLGSSRSRRRNRGTCSASSRGTLSSYA
jgi:hypothetical protein